MSKRNQRVVCIKTGTYGSPVEGEEGTLVFGADYVPGWDAGRWTVEPDSYPEQSPFGHRAVNYWTEQEMLQSWAPLAPDGTTGPWAIHDHVDGEV